MSSPFIVISSAKMVLTIRVLVVGGPAFAIQAVNDMLQPPAHGRARKMMHITKYIHSCLLPEHKGEQLLFDPGKFSFIEGLVTPDQFADVATVVVTHDHPDHLDVASLKRILDLSGATVLGNGEVVARLSAEGIEGVVFDEGTRQAGAFTFRGSPHGMSRSCRIRYRATRRS